MKRKVASLFIALLGLWFIVSGVIAPVEGFRTRNIEFLNNWPVLAIIYLVIVVAGIGLLVIARRIWR
jgi:uncharacterized membrane protein HdeD (DUF308 family)